MIEWCIEAIKENKIMRPMINKIPSDMLIQIINDHYPTMTPTKLIESLINEHYKSLYPSGKDNNDNIKETSTCNNK